MQFYQKWQICHCCFFKNALMKWNLRLLTCLVAKAVTLCFKGFINVGYSMKVLAVKFIYEKCKTLSSFSILHKRLANLIFPKQGNSAVVIGVILMLGWVNFLGNTVLNICVYSCLYRGLLLALWCDNGFAIPFAQETLSSSLNVLLVNLFMWLLSLNCVLFKVNLFWN